MTDDTLDKYCPFCKTIKVVSEFHKNKALSDGFNNKCKSCVKDYHAKNKEKIVAKNNEWRMKNQKIIREKKEEWREANDEKIKEQRKAFYEVNKDRINEEKRKRRLDPEVKKKEKEYMMDWRRDSRHTLNEYERKRYHTKRKFDLRYMLAKNFSNQLRKSLNGKSGKNKRTWESLVGYDVLQLRDRLLETMPDGYTWNDYLSGELHIDHITPVTAHNFETSNDIDFKKCWALSNLQLLPSLENILKKDKISEPFQPSLSGI